MNEGVKSSMIECRDVCPICGMETVNRYISSKCVRPEEVDLDGHVKSYRWSEGFAPHVPPSYYFTAYCSQCYFADTLEDFRNPASSGAAAPLLKDRFRESLEKSETITLLGKYIDPETETERYSSALLMHILAIYIQELLPPHMRLVKKLGRLHLRTAWLYRETAGKRPSPLKETGFREYPNLGAFLKKVKEHWPDLPISEETGLRKSLEYLEEVKAKDAKEEAQILSLISGIQRILGDYPTALDYLERVSKICDQERQRYLVILDKSINAPKPDPAKETQVRQQMEWFRNQGERAAYATHDVQNAIYVFQSPKAMAILHASKGAGPKEMTKKLLDAGLHRITIQRAVADFLHLAPGERRRSTWWNSLKKFLELE